MDEIVFGFDGHPNSATFVRLSAMARRERQLLGVVDNGVPESSYALSHVDDPGVDLAGTQDDQLLPIFNRSPATFGRDTYALTNPADNEATLVGVDVNIQSHTNRLFYLVGATASRSEGLAGNRGFLPSDTKTSGNVVVINETLARQLWPNQDAVGRRLVQTVNNSEWTVVGVASDTRFRELKRVRGCCVDRARRISNHREDPRGRDADASAGATSQARCRAARKP